MSHSKADADDPLGLGGIFSGVNSVVSGVNGVISSALSEALPSYVAQLAMRYILCF